MAELSKLTDPAAVERALNEFRSLGRDAFLTKYGMGRARRYVVQDGDTRADAKAILAAAYGYQYPAEGPLQHATFSGGEEGANFVLARLGFTVVDLGNDSGTGELLQPPARPLRLGDLYDRRSVHDIFDPTSRFTPQAGSWGLWGIVRVPGSNGDFVLFVTFGRHQGDYEFDESITDEGVLTWQSQPRQNLKSATVRELIAHDDITQSVHLFLRQGGRGDYNYLGRLRYLTHDRDRENPVHFQWQLLDWAAVPEDVKQRLASGPGPDEVVEEPNLATHRGLLPSDPPPPRPTAGVPTREFRSRRKPDYAEQDSRNRKLGLAGEQAVVDFERKRLQLAGRPELADAVRHISVEEGDGAGYDVLSYSVDGRALFLEVKTTRGPVSTDFFMSPNELAFMRERANQVLIVRVHSFDAEAGSGLFFLLSDPDDLDLRPTMFRARVVRGTAPSPGDPAVHGSSGGT